METPNQSIWTGIVFTVFFGLLINLATDNLPLWLSVLLIVLSFIAIVYPFVKRFISIRTAKGRAKRISQLQNDLAEAIRLSRDKSSLITKLGRSIFNSLVVLIYNVVILVVFVYYIEIFVYGGVVKFTVVVFGALILLIMSTRSISERFRIFRDVDNIIEYKEYIEKEIKRLGEGVLVGKSLSVSNSIKTVPGKSISSNLIYRGDYRDILEGKFWNIEKNGGMVDIENDTLVIAQNSPTTSFPYLYLDHSFIPIQGKFAIRVGVQYISATMHGTGIVFTNHIPKNGEANRVDLYRIWQDSAIREPGNFKNEKLDVEYHDIEFRWLETDYEFYIDGVCVAKNHVDDPKSRPKSIWMGNHVITQQTHPWTGFKIKYIEIFAL